jgi:6-phosphogluconate dehydrogenase
MKIGFIGLGKMGTSMVRRLLKGGHEVIAFDITEDARKGVQHYGAQTASSLAGMIKSLDLPRIIWLMVPAGHITNNTIDTLIPLINKGDILIDGGNSFYKDSMARSEVLRSKEVFFLDVGTSGGIWGLEIGYCLMIGGDKRAFDQAEPLFQVLAPENGYAHMGPSGSGHFVKMVHNAIEYAMLEAYGEGFELMNAKKEFGLDLGKISELWNHGSVIRSWLLELAEKAFHEDPRLANVIGYVEDTGEGRWATIDAIENAVPTPIITLSLLQRFRSRQQDSFSGKVIASLRNQFGGHAVKESIKSQGEPT